MAYYLHKYDERERMVDSSQTAFCRKEQKVRTENYVRLTVPRLINLTCLDLEGMLSNWIAEAYNFISEGSFQILFRASTKNFLLSTFKKIKSSTPLS